jgi:hypothetical protein
MLILNDDPDLIKLENHVLFENLEQSVGGIAWGRIS